MDAPRSSKQDDMMAGWAHFPHGADIGLTGYGPTLAAAFEQTALALTAVITDQPVAPRERVEVACQAPGADYLLIEWLNAIVFEMATRRMLFGRYEVTIEGERLVGVLHGEPLDVGRHQPAVEVKGATYTALQVGQEASGRWVARCVVDV
jgi:tRNA nucleotidyltransferase (CCA-adding enzyme)